MNTLTAAFKPSPLPQNASGIIALILRVLMGAWFTYAGAIKIFGAGLDQFVIDIENYRIVEGNVAILAGYMLPFLEIIAGFCFLLGIGVKGALLAMFGMVVAFSIAVGSAWMRKLDITCGCMGGGEPINYWRKAIEFFIYFLALGWIAWVEFRKNPDRLS